MLRTETWVWWAALIVCAAVAGIGAAHWQAGLEPASTPLAYGGAAAALLLLRALGVLRMYSSPRPENKDLY